MERLSTMISCPEMSCIFRETHLDSVNVPPPIRPYGSPLGRVRGIHPRHADGTKVFEHAAEELEIGELDGTNPDGPAQPQNHGMVLLFPSAAVELVVAQGWSMCLSLAIGLHEIDRFNC